MGIVYLAVSEGPAGFSKLKVVKQLRRDLADDIQFLNMFLDEARLAALLNHANVVQTTEIGFDGRSLRFLEMEYLDGQAFEAINRRASKTGRVPLAYSVWILTQVLAGLQYAHEARDRNGEPLRLVHRDVSPHNVFVTYDGQVKMLDFGIAKAADSSSQTRTGDVRGKATYMAPEQVLKRPLDRRADVFAVGVMLWQTLTGKRLWEGLEDGEIFLKLKSEGLPPPRGTGEAVPEALEAICMLALREEPEDLVRHGRGDAERARAEKA